MQRWIWGLFGAAALCGAHATSCQELGKPGPASLFGVAASEIASLPSAAEVAAAAPKPGDGSAIAHCASGPSCMLEGCTIMLQRGPAFGRALLGLAQSYRLKPAAGRPAGTGVVISASWPVPDRPAEWEVEPKDNDFATSATPGVFHYGKPGFAVLNCLIGRLGTTHDCMVT